MTEKGIMPEGTELTPLNPLPEGQVVEADAVLPWDSLSDDQKRLFSRMAEVYAGYSEYTDAQVGRIIEYLEESGQLENTIVMYCADNGASGEGTPNGSVNENKLFNAWPDDLQQNLDMIDQLGGPETYNHYPTGWAVAFSCRASGPTTRSGQQLMPTSQQRWRREQLASRSSSLKDAGTRAAGLPLTTRASLCHRGRR
ncbi:MAG TPA: sulfatase-like hydrolase/transferase [Baekduia sp.]|nr:sulfatase-like hydrolase/transferase [Baekduia sp.]